MKRSLGCVAVALIALASSAQFSGVANDVPAYNSAPPSHPLPAIMSGTQLSGSYFAQPYKAVVYKMAAKISGVLHQQPCYCRCDREMAHNSLHSCFESTHGAACATCMKEAIYAYEQNKLGRTPAQIRAGIERGEWMKVNYETAAL